jgi:hypothetical protein
VREKKAKFLGLMRTFDAAPKGSDGNICLKALKAVCVSLNPNVDDFMVCRIYRTAWSIGKGKFGCKLFLIAAHEHMFFYHSLQLRTLNKPLQLSQAQEIKEDSPSLPAKAAYDLFIQFKQPLNMAREIAKNLGIGSIIDSIARFEDLMTKKYQEPLEYYNGFDLCDTFRHMWLVVLQVQVIYEEMNKRQLIVQSDLAGLPKATEQFTDAIQGLLLNRLSTKFAARKIQKIWKAKAKKAVAVTATIIKSIALFKRKIKK